MAIGNSASTQRITFREIVAADIDAVINLLTSGFRNPREHWIRILQRLSNRASLPGFPKYGYVLTCNDVPVGAILLVFSAVPFHGGTRIRGSLCSWYVQPEFRSYASMLAARALRRKDITYVNVAPAAHTLPISDALGYVRYSNGWFAAVPALSRPTRNIRVEAIGSAIRPEGLQPAEYELLSEHTSFGCVCVTCDTPNGKLPFVFMRRKLGPVPFTYLVYCRDTADFVRCASPLGRFLATRGIPLVMVDANTRIPGLAGVYLNGYPKYFKGTDQPHHGDLAYSELVMMRFAGDRILGRRPPKSAPTAAIINAVPCPSGTTPDSSKLSVSI
jgi:hypothetical protein